LQSRTLQKVDQSQLGALVSDCGLVRWSNSTIVEHSGPDALDLLHRLTTKELLTITEGKSRRTALTSDRGRVIDVFVVAHVEENCLMLISDSDDSERMVSAIDYFTIIEDAELTDLSGSYDRISLVGSRARTVIESVFGIAVPDDTAAIIKFGTGSVTLASDTSRGVGWFDVIGESYALDSAIKMLEKGGVTPIDSETFEYFRIDNAIPGSDREYGEHANPIEAGLLDLIDWDKGCYVGQEVIVRLDAYDKVQRELRVLVSNSPLVEKTGLTVASKPAGVVTSASRLASDDGKYLSLALVRKAFAESSADLEADGIEAVVR
tara:strand:- start:230 stop:1192 length:963 start_codon:yes stop_codon:yes gene_type:complete